MTIILNSEDVTLVPVASVWEVTMGCNMRCMHCGSSCDAALKDELTTDEALCLIDQMKEVGLKRVTLSGGEPTTRKDIFQLIKALIDANIETDLISNGWLIDDKVIDKAIESGLLRITMSLDGLEHTHDKIRKPSSFQKVMRTLDLIKDKNIRSSIITTINKSNINELQEIGKLLNDKCVALWQLQLALPMGNMSENKDELMIGPDDMRYIIDFAYDFSDKFEYPQIFLADNIGYYNLKEIEIKKKVMSSEEDTIWAGCGAGKSGFGILHNGDVVPCTSIRNTEYIEGNIKNTRLVDMWKNGFTTFRNFSHNQLKGFCSDCMYSPICLGGCTNTRYCTKCSIESENEYCLYNIMIKKSVSEIPKMSTINEIKKFVDFCEENKNYQILNSYIQKILSNYENITEKHYLMNVLAYTYFRMELFEKAINICELILNSNPNDITALKGLGLCQYCLGDVEIGKSILYSCLEKTDYTDLEPYTDLVNILLNEGEEVEANRLIDEAKVKEPSYVFVRQN